MRIPTGLIWQCEIGIVPYQVGTGQSYQKRSGTSRRTQHQHKLRLCWGRIENDAPLLFFGVEAPAASHFLGVRCEGPATHLSGH
jgi:hypothetical protein